MIGQTLNNRYKITARLGKGAMGTVYRATDTQSGQEVALKIISNELAVEPGMLERFKREGESLRQLAHPNIVGFLDAFQYDEQYVIVMEYVSGGNLHDLVKEGPLKIDHACRIALELCDALIRSHGLNIIHRDIKPENVLLTEDGRAKLADFGVARLNEGTRMTRTGTKVGTPYYMAPEAWKGEIVDEQADIWSLGVMLFEMFSGKVPFDGDSEFTVMNKVCTASPPDLRKLRAEVSPGLVKIVRRMITRDKKQRYKTMRQVAVDLESAKQTVSGVAGTRLVEATTSYLPISGRYGILIGFLLVGCLTVGGIIAFSWKSLTASREPTGTPPSTQVIDQSSEPKSTSTPPAGQPVNVGGDWIAFNSRRSGNADIYLIDIHGDNLTQLTSGSSNDLYPSWSPDGEQIVYQTIEGGDQELAIVDVSNKNVTSLTNNNCNDWAPVWSPVNDWIVFYSDCDGERDIYAIRADGSQRTQLTFGSGSYNWFPAWSPDGKKITFSSNRTGKYRIYTMDVNGGNLKDLAAGCVSYYSPDGKQILYGVYCDDTDDLFLMNADGSNQIPLTDGYECKNATWSPDGKHIIFQLSRTTKDGPFQLYIMSLDKPEKSDWVLLTDFDVNGGSPVWQP